MTDKQQRAHTANSMETILNYSQQEDVTSQWSEEWSTTQITETNQGDVRVKMRVKGRRNIRLASLTLCSLLTMHCRVTASVLTGGIISFMLFLTMAVASVGNPMRHFEVYVGQWSLNGPGRAYRILPVFDGIGIAMGINAIFRAIDSCTVASLTLNYVFQSAKDDVLPFTYCRDFDLNPYDPERREIRYFRWETDRIGPHLAGREDETSDTRIKRKSRRRRMFLVHSDRQCLVNVTVDYCNEVYPGLYPVLHKNPSYNYLFVEVAGVRPGYSLVQFNTKLIWHLFGVWCLVGSVMMLERYSYGKVVWNIMPQWVWPMPWAWTIAIAIIAITNLRFTNNLTDVLHITTKETVAGLAEAFEVAIYIHSSSIGNAIITGKGMNYFASGHIDPLFNRENIVHSAVLLVLSGIHSFGAVLCSLVDDRQPNSTISYDSHHESIFWTLAVYSKCTSLNDYSHLTSTLIFLGLTLSYMIVGYVYIKATLHIIFEYKVKLVLKDYIVVSILICSCALGSLIYTTHGGMVLLECTEAMLTGVAAPMICVLELIALLYVYNNRDFLSDVNVAMEDSACAGRINLQWQIIPILIMICLITKIYLLVAAPMPFKFKILGSIPVFLMVFAILGKAIYNTYEFMHRTKKSSA